MPSFPRLRPCRSAAAALALAAFAALAADSGFVNDRDPRLSIASSGRVEHGASIRLRASCPLGVKECGWTYSRGRLVSTANPSMMVGFFDEPVAGRELRVVNCTGNQARCTWLYENGMFVSSLDKSLAIGVDGTPRHGARLVLRTGCKASLPECTWSRQ